MTVAAVALLVAATLRIAIPLALAAAGGVVCERSGIVNLALEGMLLLGAFGYALGAHAAGAAFDVSGQDVSFGVHLACAACGLGVAVLCACALALVHAVATVVFHADQVVSGVAANLLAAGLSKLLLKAVFGSSSNSSQVLGVPGLPGLSSIPTLGSAVGAPLLWIGAALVVLAHVVVFKTVWGLRVRATGELPAATEGAGVSVARVRIAAVVASGALAGLGGAWLCADQHQFTEGMSAGRGYIALAAVIFGKWRPGPAALACLFFAFAEALQIQLQGTSVPLPTQLLQVLPHLLALAVLAGAVGASRPPAALGRE